MRPQRSPEIGRLKLPGALPEPIETLVVVEPRLVVVPYWKNALVELPFGLAVPYRIALVEVALPDPSVDTVGGPLQEPVVKDWTLPVAVPALLVPAPR